MLLDLVLSRANHQRFMFQMMGAQCDEVSMAVHAQQNAEHELCTTGVQSALGVAQRPRAHVPDVAHDGGDAVAVDPWPARLHRKELERDVRLGGGDQHGAGGAVVPHCTPCGEDGGTHSVTLGGWAH